MPMPRCRAASLVGLAIGTSMALAPAAAEETWSASPANTKVLTRFARVMLCPEKVWPGWAADALNIVLVDFPAQEAVLFTGPRAPTAPGDNTASRRKIPYEAVPAHLKQPGPGFAMWRTEKFGEMIAVYHSAVSDGDIDQVVRIALHEAFHYPGQKGFALDWSSTRRGASYPEDVTVRYLRHEVMRSLRRAVEGAELGPVAFWANEARARPGIPDPHWIDRIEGSAEYVEQFALAIASKGCAANEQVLAATALAHANRKVAFKLDSLPAVSADTEAIVIGMYAGLLLRKSGREGWQGSVMNGTTPLEVLLENVAPMVQTRDEQLFAAIGSIVDRQNSLYKLRIDALNSALRSPTNVLVAFRSLGGNSLAMQAPPYGGFVAYQRDGEIVMATLSGSGTARFDAKAGKLTLKNADLLDANRTPCGRSGFVVPVKQEAVKVVRGWNDDRITISSEAVEATDLRVFMLSHDGMSWYCVQN